MKYMGSFFSYQKYEDMKLYLFMYSYSENIIRYDTTLSDITIYTNTKSVERNLEIYESIHEYFPYKKINIEYENNT